ncbi:hypothetical protein CLIM01_06089 [Colletotrichum limetticola]|uniref:Uncharacterized protein n=1 Tax=Colletotrichum limetticola TaxID=1209924 RepID=A0ABQ9PYC5_9PEZI|nr:hypothetical protein CLIM01_06089 [Colletotrichum limetticola]
MGERTGSRIFQWVWSYVLKRGHRDIHGGIQDNTQNCLIWGTFGSKSSILITLGLPKDYHYLIMLVLKCNTAGDSLVGARRKLHK